MYIDYQVSSRPGHSLLLLTFCSEYHYVKIPFLTYHYVQLSTFSFCFFFCVIKWEQQSNYAGLSHFRSKISLEGLTLANWAGQSMTEFYSYKHRQLARTQRTKKNCIVFMHKAQILEGCFLKLWTVSSKSVSSTVTWQ